MTRVIIPFGSSTSIESDAGSRKSVESPRHGRMPPPRTPYAFCVAGVVSATTAIGLHHRVEHHDATPRRIVHEQPAAGELAHGADGAHRLARGEAAPSGRAWWALRRLLRARCRREQRGE